MCAGFRAAVATLAAAAMCVPSAQAHFIWLSPQPDAGSMVVHVYFGEEATPDDPALLQRLRGMAIRQLRAGETPVEIPVTLTAESMTALPAAEAGSSLFVASHDLGVINRGESVFRLLYYAKSGPVSTNAAWQSVDASTQLALDVVPEVRDGNQIHVTVRFRGAPVEGAQVKAARPGMDDFEGTTDARGVVEFDVAESGVHSLRARHIEATAGELNGVAFEETRHYSTVALPVELTPASPKLQPIPQTVTSFGAAVLENAVYAYGGHTGGAHSYCEADQERHLRKLDLSTGEWSVLSEGPGLQGLALVAHDQSLYRIGGFTARNADGEDHDLWSTDEVAAFDLKTRQWRTIAALPEPRSSFDAAVLGDTIYVIGGWQLVGGSDSKWHTTAWAMDLKAETPSWTALPTPPFQRRALAVAAFDGRIFAIGGMQQDGGPSRQVDIFDPETGLWTTGPEIIGEDGMTGFGASAFATGGHLYVSTIKGTLQKLADDQTRWDVISQTPTARFFHRMLPLDNSRLLMVGGASMSVGKFEDIDILIVPAAGG